MRFIASKWFGNTFVETGCAPSLLFAITMTIVYRLVLQIVYEWIIVKS